MFLFPRLDWDIDISDFEKIDFVAHEPYLAFFSLMKRSFFGPTSRIQAPLWGRGIFYVPENFIFLKVQCLSFQMTCRTFLYDFKQKKAACLRKKHQKNTLSRFLTGASLNPKKKDWLSSKYLVFFEWKFLRMPTPFKSDVKFFKNTPLQNPKKCLKGGYP